MTESKDGHFRRYLAGGNIICRLNAKSRNEAIQEMAERLAFNTANIKVGTIVEAVLEREQLAPSVIAPGLALPHARMEIHSMLMALGISEQGIPFADGFPPVKIVVLLLTPREDPGLHLQVLSALAKDFRNPAAVETLTGLKTPEEVLQYFSGTSVEIPRYLTARDMISNDAGTLLESDTLHQAIELFARTGAQEIPLLDEEGDLRGVVSQLDILKFSLPDHILWLNDLSVIDRFQPFAEMLKADMETRMADFMRGDAVVVEGDLPAIQLAKLFLMEKITQIIVTENGKYAGVVNLQDFNRKLFWE